MFRRKEFANQKFVIAYFDSKLYNLYFYQINLTGRIVPKQKPKNDCTKPDKLLVASAEDF